MRPCPKCSQPIQDAAVLCRFCRAWVGSVPPGTLVRQPAASGMAIVSLVMGIAWMYGIASVLALVFGFLARGEIDRSQGMLTGRGMTIAGIILGLVGLISIAGLVVLASLGE